MHTTPMTHAWHTLADFHDCDRDRLTDAEGIRRVLIEAVAEAGGTYVNDIFHHFSPHGLSGVIVIAESHVALHTWPEHGFAALDVFSCTSALDSRMIQNRLKEWLRAGQVTAGTHTRGRNVGSIGNAGRVPLS